MWDELILWLIVAGVAVLAGRPFMRGLRNRTAPCGAVGENGESPCANCGLALHADPRKLKCRPGDHRPVPPESGAASGPDGALPPEAPRSRS